MKHFVSSTLLACVIVTFAACGGGDKTTAPETFCTDTACVSEPIVVQSDAPGKPFVKITFKDCKIDSIISDKGGMGVINTIVFSDFIPNEIKPSKSLIKVDIIGSTHSWIRINDCATGRGYAIKLNFDKGIGKQKFTSALNNFDPKFKVAEGLIAYYDNTFIYVQDMETNKVAKALLTDTGITEVIDYNDVHALIKDVDITKEKILAHIHYQNKDIEVSKSLEFKDSEL
ncbi:MAG: hypothetical protein QM727_15300 [Niabella sp.]